MNKTKQVNLRLSADLIEKYEIMAREDDRDRSYFMRKALDVFVCGEKKEIQVDIEDLIKTTKSVIDYSDSDSVIDSLNMLAGTKYKYSDSARKPIRKILETFTVEDCKTVIRKKCSEWLRTDMAKYLRPQTLFQASKFESYLNQIESTEVTNGRQSLSERSATATQRALAQIEDASNVLGSNDPSLRLQMD